jgi:exo-beta-1,3-glucanase (GH17 family)
LKIVIGVFIKAGGPSTADSQVDDIIKWNRWDLIEMFVVGNEAIFQGFCTANELASYIVKVTGQIREAGYQGPVTTTEPLNIYQEQDNYKPLCACMDVVGINIHPFFNPEVTPENAGTFLSGQLKIVEDLCGKTGYVLEAGWPNSGQANGKAVPSYENQAIAIKSIEEAEPGRVVIFTYRNDHWKAPGAFGVEQNFGCAQLF